MDTNENQYLHPTHRCFDDALEIIELLVLQDRRFCNELTLVHGICVSPEGEHYSHGWVEFRNKCLFRGIFKGETLDVRAPKQEFYSNFKVKEFTRYTLRQALEENFKSGHYGPWKPEYLALCGNSK